MRHLFSFLFCSLLLSCGGNNKQRTSDFNNEANVKTDLEILNNPQDLSNIIHSNLLKELEQFVLIAKERSSQYLSFDVIEVIFRPKKDWCYITIFPNPYYLSKPLYGYLILDGKMIAFYFEDNHCDLPLIKKDKLLKEIPDIYPNEKCREARESGYDPNGKTFKVNEETLELELVYSGMF